MNYNKRRMLPFIWRLLSFTKILDNYKKGYKRTDQLLLDVFSFIEN